jgi:hypothetical protein
MLVWPAGLFGLFHIWPFAQGSRIGDRDVAMVTGCVLEAAVEPV